MAVAALPTDGLPQPLQAKFQLLQQRFVLGLPARWCDIADAASTAAVQEALHRLAGAAGSYGFERLSQLARQAEHRALAAEASALAEALAALKNELDATQPGAPPAP